MYSLFPGKYGSAWESVDLYCAGVIKVHSNGEEGGRDNLINHKNLGTFERTVDLELTVYLCVCQMSIPPFLILYIIAKHFEWRLKNHAKMVWTLLILCLPLIMRDKYVHLGSL